MNQMDVGRGGQKQNKTMGLDMGFSFSMYNINICTVFNQNSTKYIISSTRRIIPTEINTVI